MVAYFDPIDFDYRSFSWKYGKPIQISRCTKIAFSPNAEFLVGCDSTGRGNLWNVATGEAIHALFDEKAPIFGSVMAFSQDGKVLAGTEYFWSVETGEPVNQIKVNFREGDSLGKVVALSPDLRIVAIAEQAVVHTPPNFLTPETRAKNPTYVTVYDVETGEDLSGLELPRPFTHTFDIHQYYRQIKFSSDGRVLTGVIELGKTKLFGGNQIYFGGDALILYEVGTGQQVWMTTNRGQDSCCNEVVFSPNGRILASSWEHVENKKHTILLSDVATGRKLCHITIDKFSENFPDFSPFPCLAFSPDGQILAIGIGQGQVGLWHLTSDRSSSLKAKKIQTLSGNASKVVSLAFSSDGRTIASAGSDVIEFWHLT
jgi:WD40 repeat protein